MSIISLSLCRFALWRVARGTGVFVPSTGVFFTVDAGTDIHVAVYKGLTVVHFSTSRLWLVGALHKAVALSSCLSVGGCWMFPIGLPLCCCKSLHPYTVCASLAVFGQHRPTAFVRR